MDVDANPNPNPNPNPDPNLPRDRDLCSRRIMLLADGREHRMGGDGVSFNHCTRAQGTVHGHQDTMALTEVGQVYSSHQGQGYV